MRKIFTTKVKKIVLLIAIYTLSVAIAYGTATFYPNKFVIDRMNKDNENKMIAEWNKFGFQEPAMEYSNSKQCDKAIEIYENLESRVNILSYYNNYLKCLIVDENYNDAIALVKKVKKILKKLQKKELKLD